MDEAHVLCDRVAIVDRGRIVTQGSPDELILSIGAPHIVELAFAGREAAGSDHPAGTHRRPARCRHGKSGRELGILDGHGGRPCTGRCRLSWGWRAEAGVEIETLATRTATLEDVFVALTGHQLRDD